MNEAARNVCVNWMKEHPELAKEFKGEVVAIHPRLGLLDHGRNRGEVVARCNLYPNLFEDVIFLPLREPFEFCDYEDCDQDGSIRLGDGTYRCRYHAVISLLVDMSTQDARLAINEADERIMDADWDSKPLSGQG